MNFSNFIKISLFSALTLFVFEAKAVKLSMEDCQAFHVGQSTEQLRQIAGAIMGDARSSVVLENGAEIPFVLFLLTDEYWLSTKAAKKREQLLKALLRNNNQVLLDRGINELQQNVLMLTAENPSLRKLFLLWLKNNIDMLHNVDSFGNTAMHFAARAGIVENIFDLIEQDAHNELMQTINQAEQTPLMLAVLSNNPEAVALIIEHGGVDTILNLDDNGNSAYDLAQFGSNGEIIALLEPYFEHHATYIAPGSGTGNIAEVRTGQDFEAEEHELDAMKLDEENTHLDEHGRAELVTPPLHFALPPFGSPPRRGLTAPEATLMQTPPPLDEAITPPLSLLLPAQRAPSLIRRTAPRPAMRLDMGGLNTGRRLGFTPPDTRALGGFLPSAPGLKGFLNL